MSVTKPEYLTKPLAAKRLGLSVRRVLELSARGDLRRHYIRDLVTQRQQAVFLAADVERLKGAMEKRLQVLAAVRPKPLVRAALRPLPVPIAAPSALPESSQRVWLTLDEAQQHIGLPASVIGREIEMGRLAALDVGKRQGGRYRVHREDLDALRGKTQVRVGKKR